MIIYGCSTLILSEGKAWNNCPERLQELFIDTARENTQGLCRERDAGVLMTVRPRIIPSD